MAEAVGETRVARALNMLASLQQQQQQQRAAAGSANRGGRPAVATAPDGAQATPAPNQPAAIQPAPIQPAPHQRVSGEARLAVRASQVAELYQRAPCRLLFPRVDDGDPLQAVSITTSGGLTGGDRVRLDVRVGPGSSLTVTTQAAEKLYRVLPDDPDIRIDTRIHVEAGGCAEWLPQGAIAFDGTRFRRRTEAHLAPGSRLLAVESLVLGRSAMGERFATGLLHDGWRIWRGRRLCWADALHLDGDFGQAAAAPFRFGSATALATIVYAGAGAAGLLDLGRALAGASGADGHWGGATCFDDLLILRLLETDAQRLRMRVMRAAAALRAAVFGWPERVPAVWRC